MGEAKQRFGEPINPAGAKWWWEKWERSALTTYVLRGPQGGYRLETTEDEAFKELIVSSLRALSGVTNVEALGALLASIKALDVMRPGPTYQVKLPDGSIVDIPTPEEVLQFWAAYDALYAPQASEAKPL